MQHRLEYGPPLYAKWESLTDTATTLYEQEITGNASLPETKEKWRKEMDLLRDRLQRLRLGGIGCKNLNRVYLCNGDEEFRANIRMTLSYPDHAGRPNLLTSNSISPSGEIDSRCGGKSEDPSSSSSKTERSQLGMAQPSVEKKTRKENTGLGAQDSLNSLVGKVLVDETIKLLLSSLAPATQTSYLRGWKFRTEFCETRGRSPWIDMTIPDWDHELLVFLTWEHIVMKIGSSALTTRFCALKFVHLVEGRGDFENKDHRVKALIESVKRKGSVNQKSPVNPELLRWGEKNISWTSGDQKQVDTPEVWTAIITGFHFALRISEIDSLIDNDISFENIDGVSCVTVVIRGSKTDQQKNGVRRTLAATHCDLCPVRTLAKMVGHQRMAPIIR